MVNIPGTSNQIPGGDGPCPITIYYNGQIVLKTDSFGDWIECELKNRVNAAIGLIDIIKARLSGSGYATQNGTVLPEHYFDVGPFRTIFTQDKILEEQFTHKSKTLKSIEYKPIISFIPPGWKNYEEDIIRVQKRNEMMEPIVLEIINNINRVLKLTPFL